MAHGDYRQRKRNATYQQTPTWARHEPLRGYGVKRDPPILVPPPAVLRGQGVKRSPPRRQMDYNASNLPGDHTRAQPWRLSEREPVWRHGEYHRAEWGYPTASGHHFRHSNPIVRDPSIGLGHNRYRGYRMPESYYIDICAERPVINRVIEATIYETVRPAPKPRHLRRQPAHSRLRYDAYRGRHC